ncbi:MAG: class I SAM-dependent methyltransferase [Pseudomonadota bacterium]
MPPETTERKSAEAPPRMVGASDVARVAAAAAAMPKGAIAVEFGPWLGGLSIEIAGQAELHVVDRFIWTSDHAKRVPDLAAPGESFRPQFERTLADHGLAAVIHETAFEDFTWTGGEIALVVIDGPKKARDLASCLQAVSGSLAQDAQILIKNALRPEQEDLIAYLDGLVGGDHLVPAAEVIPSASNLGVFHPGPSTADWPAPGTTTDRGALVEAGQLAEDHPLRLAPLMVPVRAGNWAEAYTMLSKMPPARGLRRAWEKRVSSLAGTSTDPEALATFSEVLAIHHTAVPADLPEPIHKSDARALRGYWLNSAERASRGKSFRPDILLRARAYGYLDWPSKVREHIYGKDVLDIGCGPGLHGLGYLAVGARRYLGLDPIINRDADRVKNLVLKRKEPFGWSPAEIARAIDDWDVQGLPIEYYAGESQFDIVTMHNVTEHLLGIEAVFAEVARLLRPGGHLLFNHHNFFAWNGHHSPPKSLSDFDPGDQDQLTLVDWGHLSFEPPPDHYIARGLNRIRLDALKSLTKKHFEIVSWEHRPSSAAVGGNRLTDEIRARHPELTDTDFLTQNVLCLARVA